MLLSDRKPCTASSARNPYPAANVTDENPRTFWRAGSNRAGEWLTLDLEHACEVNAVQVNLTDHKKAIATHRARFRRWWATLPTPACKFSLPSERGLCHKTGLEG